MTNCSRRLQTWFLLFRQKRFTKILLAKWFPLFGQAIIYISFVHFVTLEGSSSRCYIFCIFIWPKSDHCLAVLVTQCSLRDLTDVTLAYEDSRNSPCLASCCQFWQASCWHCNKTKVMLSIPEQNKSLVEFCSIWVCQSCSMDFYKLIDVFVNIDIWISPRYDFFFKIDTWLLDLSKKLHRFL